MSLMHKASARSGNRKIIQFPENNYSKSIQVVKKKKKKEKDNIYSYKCVNDFTRSFWASGKTRD